MKPFVKKLPYDSSEYFQILSENNAYLMRSGFVTLKPGEQVGVHDTEDYEEMIVFLEGSGRVETVGDDARAVSAKDVAYNPPHSQHNVINTGDEDLRYVYVVSKAG